MFEDDDYLTSPLPFWFATSELLGDLYRTELTAVSRILYEDLELPKLFDTPEATPAQRTTCFALLAHRKLAETIEETLLGRYEQPQALGDAESSAIYRTLNLVSPDAPLWVLDMDNVVEQLPHRMLELLPEPLRRQGFDRKDDSAQLEAMKSFSTVEQIQTFTEQVLDQQLRRLQGRWSATTSVFNPSHQAQPDQAPVPKAYPSKGVEGLIRKNDLSRYSHYMDKLTERQRLAFSLKFEYGLGLTQIALRMEIDRKTVDEHIKAAEKKINQARSNEKSKARSTKRTPEF
jgi:RNA polymerase sigma factor (sigma-70 family)